MCLTSRLNGDSKFAPSLWVAQVLLEIICSELIFGDGNCDERQSNLADMKILGQGDIPGWEQISTLLHC